MSPQCRMKRSTTAGSFFLAVVSFIKKIIEKMRGKSSAVPAGRRPARRAANWLICWLSFGRPRLARAWPPGEVVGPEIDRDRGEAHHDAHPENRRVMDRPPFPLRLRWLHDDPRPPRD